MENFRRASHDIYLKIIDWMHKFPYDFQINAHLPIRIKFTPTNKDVSFNNKINVEVLYLEDGPTLHLVDTRTNEST